MAAPVAEMAATAATGETAAVRVATEEALAAKVGMAATEVVGARRSQR